MHIPSNEKGFVREGSLGEPCMALRSEAPSSAARQLITTQETGTSRVGLPALSGGVDIYSGGD